jgi:hypothetical protein
MLAEKIDFPSIFTDKQLERFKYMVYDYPFYSNVDREGKHLCRAKIG